MIHHLQLKQGQFLEISLFSDVRRIQVEREDKTEHQKCISTGTNHKSQYWLLPFIFNKYLYIPPSTL